MFVRSKLTGFTEEDPTWLLSNLFQIHLWVCGGLGIIFRKTEGI